MAIEKPKLFENLRRWREKNNLTTPEWNMYAQGLAKQTAVVCITSFVIGLTYSVLFLR